MNHTRTQPVQVHWELVVDGTVIPVTVERWRETLHEGRAFTRTFTEFAGGIVSTIFSGLGTGPRFETALCFDGLDANAAQSVLGHVVGEPVMYLCRASTGTEAADNHARAVKAQTTFGTIPEGFYRDV